MNRIHGIVFEMLDTAIENEYDEFVLNERLDLVVQDLIEHCYELEDHRKLVELEVTLYRELN